LLNKVSISPRDNIEAAGGAQASPIDVTVIAVVLLRRWKLITIISLSVLIATFGVVKISVPPRYKSTVEILVYDPQRQMDSAIQKPISPFVDALGNDAMSTEIAVLKSKSVALRVATELGLDTDPEFQSNGAGIADLVHQLRIRDLAKQLGIADLVKRLGVPDLVLPYVEDLQTISGKDEKVEKLDRAADSLIKGLEVWQESYVIFVSATARDPVKAQLLASTIANDYLASQREARQEALDHAATWLRGRMDSVHSHVLEADAAVEKFKFESGGRDIELGSLRELQIRDLNAQLLAAREDINNRSAHFDQARNVIGAHGDLDSIPELTASAMLTELRHRKMELNLSLADLQRLGEHNPKIIDIRAQLVAIDRQMDAEAEKILVVMANAYDLAVQREKSLQTNLQNLSDSETYVKLQQLRHEADAAHKEYQSHLDQYNDISERRETQFASARIISPATFPRSPTSSRMKFYAIGGIVGLGGSLLLAFTLEYFKSGLRTSAEIEQSFGLPVVGCIPLVYHSKSRSVSYEPTLVSFYPPLNMMINQPLSQLSEAIHAIRISLELSSGGPRVILLTSALPGEGKTTAAMLLAASSAGSGKKTILLDCDLRLRATSRALRGKHRLGLSELLMGTAKIDDVITEDPVTKLCAIPAGSTVRNVADLLMSQGMLDLIAALRNRGFDYIVMDTPPLLPVVDALALSTIADKIVVIVEWGRTPRASLYEAFRVLGAEANRVAGVVLNKVDFGELPGYGGRYLYPSITQYYHRG